jgi:hypothetical protein
MGVGLLFFQKPFFLFLFLMSYASSDSSWKTSSVEDRRLVIKNFIQFRKNGYQLIVDAKLFFPNTWKEEFPILAQAESMVQKAPLLKREYVYCFGCLDLVFCLCLFVCF